MMLTDSERRRVLRDIIETASEAAQNDWMASTHTLIARAEDIMHRKGVVMVDKVEYLNLQMDAMREDSKGGMALVAFMACAISGAAMGALISYFVMGGG